MSDFFANIWETIGLLVWSDWLTIAILIGFLVVGIKRGLAKELINLAFLILAIIVAWLFYQWLAGTVLITWLTLSHQSHLAIAFGVLFIGTLLIKKALYKLTNASSSISNPCTLNQIFALFVFFTATAVASWHYLDGIAGLGIMEIVVTNESLRIGLSFAIVFAIIVGVCSAISNALNISIGSSKPCLLESFFQKILNGLHGVDSAINARNVDSTKNKLLGGLIGLIKGSLAILIMVLVLQSIEWVSQQDYWVETKGTLRTFQDVASDIKPELSQHLLFIESE
ncbi:MAG: CvpA family protein [Gammaproteobacteria bacterium]|nr:CvpA family protein [Gammaproteobacteria bacterium]